MHSAEAPHVKPSPCQIIIFPGAQCYRNASTDEISIEKLTSYSKPTEHSRTVYLHTSNAVKTWEKYFLWNMHTLYLYQHLHA